jgi:FkbM family methyltransferase
MIGKLLSRSVNMVPWSVRSRIHAIPLVAPLQRWCLNHFLNGKPFVHQVNAGPATGLQFEITLPADKAVWSGTYETTFASALAESVRRGDVCYDIGGYRGFMSGVMALAGASKVIVFEPLPANQRALKRLRELNGDLAIEIQAIAVGGVDGEIALQVMPDTSMGKLATSAFQTEVRRQSEIQVEIRKIDSLVESGEIPSPNLMKIDVEGAEMDVLSGASVVIERSRPKIFLEAHSAELQAACSRELAKQDYTIRNLDSWVADADRTCHLIATPL